jgi:hypothetical protein
MFSVAYAPFGDGRIGMTLNLTVGNPAPRSIPRLAGGDPLQQRGDGDNGLVRAGGLVVARRDGAGLFEPIETAFDHIAHGVGVLVERRRPSTPVILYVAGWRHDRRAPEWCG